MVLMLTYWYSAAVSNIALQQSDPGVTPLAVPLAHIASNGVAQGARPSRAVEQRGVTGPNGVSTFEAV